MWIMDIGTLLILAIGVSMDAFAVSICKGLAMKKICFKHMAVIGLWFGGLIDVACYKSLRDYNRLVVKSILRHYKKEGRLL